MFDSALRQGRAPQVTVLGPSLPQTPLQTPVLAVVTPLANTRGRILHQKRHSRILRKLGYGAGVVWRSLLNMCAFDLRLVPRVVLKFHN